MASIIKDKNDNYQVRYYATLKDGSRKQLQKKFERRSDAKRFASEIEAADHAGTYVEADRQSFSKWLDAWLAIHGHKLQPNTLESYQCNAKKAKEYFLNKRVQSITPSAIDGFYAHLLKTYSATTVQRVHALLRRAYQDALRDGLVPRNPFDLVERPKAQKYKSTPPTQQALAALLAGVEGTPYYLPIYIAASAGLRLSEVMGLYWDDINLDTQMLSVRRVQVTTKEGLVIKPPKTEKSARDLQMPDKLVQVLRAAKKAQLENQLRLGRAYHRSPFVCVYNDGLQVSRYVVSSRVPATLQAAGYPRARFHDLRHANVTMMLKAGLPIQIVSARSGHSTTSTTVNIYGHVIAGMDEMAAQEINKMIP